MEFSAPGYVTKKINNVQVNHDDSLRLDVQLWKGVPEIDFTTTDTVSLKNMQIEFKDMSKGYPTSWEWTFEGGEPHTSNLQNPKVVYKNEGTFDVKLKVTNEVGSSELIKEGYMVITFENSVVNLETEHLKVYSQDNSLIVDTQSEINYFVISDLIGRVVYNGSLHTGNNRINTENFASGVYIIKAVVDGRNITKKVILN